MDVTSRTLAEYHVYRYSEPIVETIHYKISEGEYGSAGYILSVDQEQQLEDMIINDGPKTKIDDWLDSLHEGGVIIS